MKFPLMLKYIISAIALLFSVVIFAQESTLEEAKDTSTIVHKQSYGLRVGVDLSRPIRSFLKDNYQGFEIVGDYRISNRIYLAAEIGTEKRTTKEDLYTFTTKGNYIKIGADYNSYENWYGMENSIYVGMRVATSTFNQTLDNYQIYSNNQYWNEGNSSGNNTNLLQEHSGLNALWLEGVFGMKAELFNNLYIGASIRLGMLINDKEATNFPNLWIPGFNKVTDNSNFGVGFNYSISYLIPFYKKANKKEKETKETIEN